NEYSILVNSFHRLLLKTFVLVIAILFLSVQIDISSIGKLSLYNKIFKGRVRLPFGENSSKTYNITLNNLDALFASHEINGLVKRVNEYRIFVIGDSSNWGILLRPDETLASLIETGLLNCSGKEVNVFNLGYPTLSLLKDVMVMEYALKYEPDLIIWPLTLESFPVEKQLTNPLVKENLHRIRLIDQEYGMFSEIDISDDNESLLDRSIIGHRKEIADLIRLQVYGFLWSATGIDQSYPTEFPKAQIDLENTLDFYGVNAPDDLVPTLEFSMLNTMVKIAGEIPILFVNEPILISDGINSDVRYNFYYPIWAYDEYRSYLGEYLAERNWRYLDLWNIIPISEFTNSAIHLSPEGERSFSSVVINYLNETICNVE
ncbi:hypothetical protein ACFLXB_06480, partial [Chloroflexota bacterium]